MNILLALRQRDRAGEGCHLDIAMTDAMFTFGWYALAIGSATGQFPAPGELRLVGSSPRYRLYSTKDGKLAYQQIPGWNGKCTPGESFNASNCNQKLIGAQWFNAAWGGDAGIDAQRPWEFNSPRDYNGHGTHTSGSIVGNGFRSGSTPSTSTLTSEEIVTASSCCVEPSRMAPSTGPIQCAVPPISDIASTETE